MLISVWLRWTPRLDTFFFVFLDIRLESSGAPDWIWAAASEGEQLLNLNLLFLHDENNLEPIEFYENQVILDDRPELISHQLKWHVSLQYWYLCFSSGVAACGQQLFELSKVFHDMNHNIQNDWISDLVYSEVIKSQKVTNLS